jgi:hypothetical protein
MSKLQTKTITVIAVTLLSQFAMSLAQAGQDGKETSAVGVTVKKQQGPHKAIYNTTRNAPTVYPPTATPDGTFHMNLTWPEGSPDYHGSNGG